MKKLIITVLTSLSLTLGTAQTVYFYTNNIAGIVGKIRIYQGEQNIADIGNNQWIKVNINATNSANFKFTWGMRSSKKVTVNFTNKDCAFIYIHLDPMIWSVYEQNYPNVPSVVWNDYAEYKNEILKRNRLANHPKTNWTETKLKQRFNNESDEVEGIYENSFSSENSPRYKVGVIKDNGIYKLIYLSGGEPEFWEEGDIKAILIETATPFLYKTKWYMGDKSQTDEVYLSFKQGMFTTVFGNGSENLYIKLFPASNEVKNSATASSGTGFALSDKGYIVTNHHVIENATKITVLGINGDFTKPFNGTVIVSDKLNDLAILQIESSIEGIPYSISTKLSEVGESVSVLGYPLRASMGDEIKLTTGIISARTGFQGDISSYQISAPVQPGNSGGPVFNESGVLFGIVSAKHLGADNASYAIKSTYLRNLIDLLPQPVKSTESNALKGLSLSEQVKILKKYVYIIEAE